MTITVAIFLFLFAAPGITSPAEWSVQSSRLPVIVTTGDSEVKQLHVTGLFVETTDRTVLPANALVVCKEAAGNCDSNISIPAHTMQTIYLRYDGPVMAGKYSGHLRISSAGYNPEVKNLTLYVSSTGHVLLGIMVAGVGALLAWWVKVYANNRITRAHALLPAAMYRERLTSLDAVLKRARAQLHTQTPALLQAAVASWLRKLDPDTLEIQYNLPFKTPSPFIPTPTVSSSYTSFLSQADVAINLLSILVRDGVERVLDLTDSQQILPPQAAEAIGSIDALYAPGLTEEAAREGIRVSITKALTPQPANSPQPSRAVTPPASRSQLLIEIRRLNVTAWFVLVALAAVGTIYTFVLKPDFGSISDYILCLGTSFGIPTLGGIAIPAQTTAATVTSSVQGVSGSTGLTGV